MGKDAVAAVLLVLEVPAHHQHNVLIDVLIVFGERAGEVWKSLLYAVTQGSDLGISLVLHLFYFSTKDSVIESSNYSNSFLKDKLQDIT